MKEFLPESDLSFLESIFRKLKKSKLIVTTTLLVSGQALYISLPFLLGMLVDQLVVKNQWSIFWILLFPITWLISTILSSLGKLYSSILTQDVRKTTKEIIFRHFISLPNSVYITRNAGEVENLMQELSFSSRYMINENFPFFIRTGVTILLALFIIWNDSNALSIIFLIWTFLYIPISYVSAKKSIKYVSSAILSASEVSASTVEVVQNHELIPAFGTENFEISRFNYFLDKERECFNKAQIRIDLCDLSQRILQLFLPFGLVLFLIFSDKLVQITPGGIAAILSLTLVLTSQIGEFGKGISSFLEMRERMKTALLKLACPPKLRGEDKTKEILEPKNWDIQFENVSFSYEGDHFALQNINLEIKENEKIGVIGYSGAGKTTLVKLLRGFLKSDNGFIKIGNVALSNINPESLARNIAEVSQSIPLFHRTLRENVAYGLHGVNDDEIWKILEKARLADYVKGLPEGLDTVIGVRGQKLSGGERARLGIARAFIRNAKIIILDEATAAIDSESELLIQKGLNELMQGRTIIAIAHRLSTLRTMDRILVLDKGQIVAQGSHQELINHSTIYKQLWNTQILI